MNTPLNTDMPPDVNDTNTTNQYINNNDYINTNTYTNTNTDKLSSAIETNTPEKKESSAHILELIATIYLLASIAGGVYIQVALNNSGNSVWPYIVWSQGYLFYLITVICCNKTRKYLENMTSRAEYETVYYSIKNTPAHFVFQVTCYHYEQRVSTYTVTDSNGNTRTETRVTTEKVVTHTASKVMEPKLCIDVSGHIQEINEQKSAIFIKYQGYYEYQDTKSQNTLQNAFNDFKRNHDLDVHQDAWKSFVIPGMVQRVGFFTHKPFDPSSFYLCAFIGAAYIYGMCIEKSIARYKIGIRKRMTY